jgi:hypothetical protein
MSLKELENLRIRIRNYSFVISFKEDELDSLDNDDVEKREKIQRQIRKLEKEVSKMMSNEKEIMNKKSKL